MQAKAHFEALVKAHDTYAQNSGGGTAGRHAYENANSMADLGDEIKDYIVKSTSVTNNEMLANIRDTLRTKDSQIEAMAAQLKLLSETVAFLAKNAKPADSGARGGQSQQMTKPRNMGAYCTVFIPLESPTIVKHANSRKTVIATMPRTAIATKATRIGLSPCAWPSTSRIMRRGRT